MLLDTDYSVASEAAQAEPVAALAAVDPAAELIAWLRSVPAIAQMADMYGPRFVLWRVEPGKDGKPTKKPKRLDGQANAKSTDPSTWNTLERCCTALPHTPAG